MRKMIWTLSLSLLILAPVGCGTKTTAPKTDSAAAATPVFQDGFEKGKAEAWEKAKTGEQNKGDQSPSEGEATQDSE